jgi:hypothetical protein
MLSRCLAARVLPAGAGVGVVSYSASLQRFQEGQERVGGSVSAGWGSERGGAFDGLLRDVEVGLEVDLGGLGALVAELQGDREDVDALGS